MYNTVYIRTSQTTMKSDKIKKDPTPKVKETKVWPKYLFKPGEKFVHRDEFGNIWYEEIKTK